MFQNSVEDCSSQVFILASRGVSVIFEICFASSARVVFGFLFKGFANRADRFPQGVGVAKTHSSLAPREKPLFESFCAPLVLKSGLRSRLFEESMEKAK